MLCPCGTEKNFSDCCQPLLTKEKRAQTVVELMRSRYTAFVKGDMDYILETHDPKRRKEVDMEANQAWSTSVDWLGLEIVKTEEGEAQDEKGWVEFIVRYKSQEGEKEHHELSEFRKRNGIWYFVDGRQPSRETIVREQPKVGRNDPCPCGSGKKYKKCCGAN